MPKITRYGGHSIAGITDTATGQTERGKGLVEDTEKTRLKYAARASDDPTGDGYTDTGDAVGGLVAKRAGEDDSSLPFDPSQLSVADVNALLEDASDAEREAVIEAERKDKNRKGITG